MFKSGVGFFVLFGLGWWLLAASAFSGGVWGVAVVVGCLAAGGLLIAARRVAAAGAVGTAPLTSGQRRRFNQVNGVQWLLIVGLAIVCVRAGAPALVAPLVAVVVGVHFVPLAAVFDQRRLHVPAAALLVVGLAGVVVWLADGPAALVRLVVGIGSTATLWGTALWTLRGMRSYGRVTTGG